jgi:hypothetical protein
MTRAVVVGLAVTLAGLVVAGVAAADAVTKAPGLLRLSDLPGSFQISGGPTTYVNPAVLRVDAQACTETIEVDPSALGGVQIAFARVGAPRGDLTLAERVVSFSNAKMATAAFVQRSKDHAARIKCGKLGFVQPGKTTVTGTTTYQGGKFPSVGGGSILESSGTPGTVNTNTSVTFVSGNYIVGLTTFGGTDPLSVKDFKLIAPRALKRLPHPTSITPTSTT